MKDYLVRAVARETNIRALACVSTELVEEARRRHGAFPTAAAALGRALTGGALMSALLKVNQRLVLKFEGNGPLGKLIVEADANGQVRGYVSKPQTDLPSRNGKLDVSGALGTTGLLTVVKDLRLKEPYTGAVQFFSGEVAEDIAYYLTESEQVPSAVGLGVFVESEGHVSAAGGFLIQSLPPADDSVLDRVIASIRNLPAVTELVRSGKTPEEMLEMIFQGIPLMILQTQPLEFRCSCSRERVERALLSLGNREIGQMMEEEEAVDVRCEFCREKYPFNRAELKRLAEELPGEQR